MSNNRYFPVDVKSYGPKDNGLIIRLSGLVKKLIINLRPREKLPTGEEYEPRNEESDSIWTALFYTIRASHLNTFDPTVSIQHKFDGKLRRQKKHTQDFTSLSLFRDEVECLLRELYGDVESEALDSIIWAVFRIVEEFTKYVRPDLWEEHRDAEDFDLIVFGIGVPEGCGIDGSEYRRGMKAKANLFRRAREVNANPSAFSEYTREFAKLFAERWDCTTTAPRLVKPPRCPFPF